MSSSNQAAIANLLSQSLQTVQQQLLTNSNILSATNAVVQTNSTAIESNSVGRGRTTHWVACLRTQSQVSWSKFTLNRKCELNVKLLMTGFEPRYSGVTSERSLSTAPQPCLHLCQKCHNHCPNMLNMYLFQLCPNYAYISLSIV